MGRRRRGKKWARDAEPWTEDDIVLWRVKRKDGELRCAQCQGIIALNDVYLDSDDGRRCRDCLGMRDFRFVPAGDATLTRAVSRHSEVRGVVVRRHGRNVYRDGVLAEEAAVRCAADRYAVEPEAIVADLVVSRGKVHRQRKAQRSLRQDDEPKRPRQERDQPEAERPDDKQPKPRRRRRRRRRRRKRQSTRDEPSSRNEPSSVEATQAKSSRYWPDPARKRRRQRRATSDEKELAKRIGREMPESKPHRRLEVARWALEALGSETDDLSAKTIVLRWIRR